MAILWRLLEQAPGRTRQSSYTAVSIEKHLVE
jgi:hypothetical protein